MKNTDLLLNEKVEIRHDNPAELIDEIEAGKSMENGLIVIDDGLNYSSGKNSPIISLFNRLANHSNVSVIFISQSCFGSSLLRAVVQNTNLFVVFPSRNDPTSLTILSSRLFPSKPQFISSALKQIAAKDPFSPLLISTRPDHLWEKMRVWSGFLEGKLKLSQYWHK